LFPGRATLPHHFNSHLWWKIPCPLKWPLTTHLSHRTRSGSFFSLSPQVWPPSL
jgi:hypothetical protein